ncbi:MAG: diguanylate cyclase [Idiomarina sp.]
MNLKLRWFVTFAAWAVVLTTVISVLLTQVASNQIREQAGSNLADVAYQMSDKLERGMFERYRDIQVAASLVAKLQQDGDTEAMRRLLNRLQTTYSDYAWIGLTDAEGKVLVSTQGMLEGNNVAERPWFRNALNEDSYVGDVHPALLLEEVLASEQDGEPMRFVDIAVPIRNEKGDITGVLGSHLNWRWGRELERSVINTMKLGGSAELILVGANNQVVLGPNELVDKQIDSQALDKLSLNNSGYLVETWDNGITYVVGYAQNRGYRDYQGLDWKVIVRQPLRDTFAPVTALRENAIWVSLAVVVLFALIGWFSAERISRPLLEITAAAKALGNDPRVNKIPMLRDYPEVNDLSAALNILIQRVDDKQRQLTQLNEDLDHKVRKRTKEVLKANEDLKYEIAERRKAQQEREKLIQELERQASTDALTNLANRRYLFEHGDRLLKRAKRQDQPISMLMFDLDYFKNFNDEFGHAAGDDVLVAVGNLILGTVRETDIGARTGGEEFAVVLDATDLEGAEMLANRLHRGLNSLKFDSIPDDRTVTMSLGIALWDREESLEQLLNRADKVMYQAKEKGRNQTVTASA